VRCGPQRELDADRQDDEPEKPLDEVAGANARKVPRAHVHSHEHSRPPRSGSALTTVKLAVGSDQRVVWVETTTLGDQSLPSLASVESTTVTRLTTRPPRNAGMKPSTWKPIPNPWAMREAR